MYGGGYECVISVILENQGIYALTPLHNTQPKIAFMIKHFLDPRFSLMALFLALTVVSAICPSECVGDSFNNAALQAAVAAWCDNSTAAFDVYGDITTWCVGDVTSMQSLFDGFGRGDFNEDIGCWDVR